MLPDRIITTLPTAGPINGTEVLPMVQAGRTVKVTTSQLAGTGLLTQTIFTLNQENTFPQSRQLKMQYPMVARDDGPLGNYTVGIDPQYLASLGGPTTQEFVVYLTDDYTLTALDNGKSFIFNV